MKRGVELSGGAEREIEATFQAARINFDAAASNFVTVDLSEMSITSASRAARPSVSATRRTFAQRGSQFDCFLSIQSVGGNNSENDPL